MSIWPWLAVAATVPLLGIDREPRPHPAEVPTPGPCKFPGAGTRNRIRAADSGSGSEFGKERAERLAASPAEVS